MTNHTHAVAIITQAIKHPELAHDIADELNNAGLLAPTTDDHPTTLKTAEDYENAPVGTVAAINGFDPITKSKDGWQDDELGIMSDSEVAELAVAPREVLRWGKNK